MTKQIINLGAVANDGSGDTLRNAFDKINDNFTETYNGLVTSVSQLSNDSGYLTATTDHIVLTGRYQLGTTISFSNVGNVSLGDAIGPGLTIKRNVGGGAIYNSELEAGYDQVARTSPLGTEWNADGYGNLDTVKNRHYTSFTEALKHAVGLNVLNADLVMHDMINDKYYKVEFSQWAVGAGAIGTFSYNRAEILVDDSIGITFPDGTYQPSAWTGTIKKYDAAYIGQYSGHELNAEEAGHLIYFYNTHVILTANTENDCPVGTFYTLAVGEELAGVASLRLKQYEDVGIIPTIETQIVPVTDIYGNVDYPLDQYSTAILIKTDENTWTLSPSGIQTKLTGSVYDTNNNLLVDASIGKIVASVDTTVDWTVDVADAVWKFGIDGNLTFPDASIQSGASISVTDLKTLVADSADFVDFQARIASL